MPVDLLALFTRGIWVRSKPKPAEDIIMPIDVQVTTDKITVDVEFIED